MKMKSIIAIMVAAVFLLSAANLSLAKGTEKGTIKGTVTAIDGNKVTVKDNMGNETSVDVKDVKDTKVGDKVKIKNGVIKKMTGKHEKSEKPEKSGY